IAAVERSLHARRSEARALLRAGDYRFLLRELPHFRLVEREVQAEYQAARRRESDLGLQALAGGPADVGRELDRIGLPVGLHLNVAPIDVVRGQVRGQPAVEPAALQADLVVGEVIG